MQTLIRRLTAFDWSVHCGVELVSEQLPLPNLPTIRAALDLYLDHKGPIDQFAPTHRGQSLNGSEWDMTPIPQWDPKPFPLRLECLGYHLWFARRSDLNLMVAAFHVSAHLGLFREHLAEGQTRVAQLPLLRHEAYLSGDPALSPLYQALQVRVVHLSPEAR